MFTSNTAAVQKARLTDLTSMLISDSPAVAARQCSSWSKPRTQSFWGRQRSRSSFLSQLRRLTEPVFLFVVTRTTNAGEKHNQTWTAGFSQSSLWSLLPKWVWNPVNTRTHTFSVSSMINDLWIPQLSFIPFHFIFIFLTQSDISFFLLSCAMLHRNILKNCSNKLHLLK